MWNISYILVDFFLPGKGSQKKYEELRALYEEFKDEGLEIYTIHGGDGEDLGALQWKILPREHWWTHSPSKKGLYNLLIDNKGSILGQNLDVRQIKRLVSGRT